MEIERKFLVSNIPDLSEAFEVKKLEQGYISTSPVIRIRKSNNQFILTCKGKGLMAREEFELPLSEDEFLHLKQKTDHHTIIKTRYLISFLNHTIELDIFEGQLKGLVIAEVEFNSLEEANSFLPPTWFGEDVTMDYRYQNSHLTTLSQPPTE